MKLLTLTTAFAFSLAASAAPKVGDTAPAFQLTDASGKTHKLADYKGKIVVLEWWNKDCPFVKKHYESGNMQKLQADAQKDGVVWLTINSSAPGEQGAVDAKQVAMLKGNEKPSTPVLLDPTGAAGRAFDAKVTPHMYVIDKAGKLAYMGAIDSKASTKASDIPKSENYVVAALTAVKAGKAVEKNVTDAYGCGVKYK